MRLLTLLLLTTQILNAQPHPAWRHYTLNDGLPDNKVYGMCEDPTGHLWLATNSGICRFDGYKFERFPAPEDVNSVSCFLPQTDESGRLWFRWTNGKLFYFENDTVRAWQHNHLLDSLKGKFAMSVDFSIRPDGAAMLRMVGMGFLLVKPDGSSQLIQNDPLTNLFGEFRYGFRPSNNSLTPQQKEVFNKEFIDKKLHAPIVLLKTNGQRETIPPFLIGHPDKPANIALSVGKDSVLLLNPYGKWLWANGKIALSDPGNSKSEQRIYAHVQKLRDGKLYVSRITNGAGLYVYPDLDSFFADKPTESLLLGTDVSSAWIDSRGALWASSLDEGLFYRPNPGIAIWDEASGLPSRAVKRLATDGKNRLFLATANHQIFQLEMDKGLLRDLKFPPINVYINALFFDTSANKLFVCGTNLPAPMVWDGKKWKGLEVKHPDPSHTPAIFARKMFRSRDGSSYLGIAYGGPDRVDIKSGIVLKAGKNQISSRAFDLVEMPDGRFVGAYSANVFQAEGDTQTRLPELPEKPFRRVEEMTWLPDSTLALASFSNGVGIWKNSFFRIITAADGLASNYCSILEAQGDSVIWANSFNLGLNKIMGWRPGENLSVQTISRENGLPTNEINDFCWAAGFLWVGTGAGLVRLKPPPVSKLAPSPLLKTLFVNGTETLKFGNGGPASDHFLNHNGEGNPIFSKKRMTFKADQNNFQFKFYALNYRQNGKINYRFRISEKSSWQEGMATEALFSALSPGKYRFEVQAQNEDKIWGEPAVFAFEILPPWWATWWFRFLILGGTAAAVYLFFKTRTRRLKEKFALQKQLSELEQTALRAQMNPHFISNCLNSIQKLVLENQNEAAIRYLAKFAKLTRAALEFSGRAEITLHEEVAYLENYLLLEKLRFKEKFDFKIEVAPGIDLLETRLPPMLVQPLAENAVKHGLSETHSGGLLEIRFSKPGGEAFRIEVLDTGKGFSKNVSPGPHALGIVKKRLELMATGGRAHRFFIGTRSDGVSGTLAFVEILK